MAGIDTAAVALVGATVEGAAASSNAIGPGAPASRIATACSCGALAAPLATRSSTESAISSGVAGAATAPHAARTTIEE